MPSSLLRTSLAAAFVSLLATSPARAADSRVAAPRVLAPDRGSTRLGDDIEIHEIAPRTWRYVTWFDLPPYGKTPANGLLVVSGREAILVNTGWTDDQAARLADWVEGTIGARIEVVVPTHAHADTIGGLAALHRRGATSWAQEQTISIARSSGQEVPRHGFGRAKELRVGERVVKLAFHGGGHTPDNIVVWLPEEQILFGGCLVKSASSKDLGSVADARLADWPATMKAVLEAYPGARFVIPGHGDPGDRRLLTHTLELAETAQAGAR